MSSILNTERLSISFGGLQAVNDVRFTVEAGQLHAVIGPNGAGKTSLFNLITGHLRPTAGRIWFQGQDITGLPQHAVARRGIAKSYQITTVFKNLTVFENLRVAAQAKKAAFNFWRQADGLPAATERAWQILEVSGLTGKANVMAAHLSHGEQRHLDIGIALAGDPQLLLLDEPTAGMSPIETEEAIEFIRELAQRVSIVLVEHKMNVVMKISDRITVMHFGSVLFEGTPEEVRANQKVQDVYLEGLI